MNHTLGINLTRKILDLVLVILFDAMNLVLHGLSLLIKATIQLILSIL